MDYIKGEITNEWWRVYNRIATAWYEQEYGQIETAERWYEPAMVMMESMQPGRVILSSQGR